MAINSYDELFQLVLSTGATSLLTALNVVYGEGLNTDDWIHNNIDWLLPHMVFKGKLGSPVIAFSICGLHWYARPDDTYYGTLLEYMHAHVLPNNQPEVIL